MILVGILVCNGFPIETFGNDKLILLKKQKRIEKTLKIKRDNLWQHQKQIKIKT